MNQPGTGEVGRVAIARSDGKIDWVTGAEEGANLKWNGSSWVKRRGAIVPNLVANDSSAATANSNAINAALLAAYASGARTDAVEIPAGAYYVDGSIPIDVLYGCSLTGVRRGHSSGSNVFGDVLAANSTGTRLLVKGTGAGTNSTYKQFIMRHQARLMNLEITYADQVTNATPDPYDYMIYIGANEPGCHVENITATNPYKLLYATSPARVNNIYGFPLAEGIHLARVADVMRVSNVHFNNINYAHGATLISWVEANGTAFWIEQAEEFEFTDCFAILYATGYRFEMVGTPDGSGAYGSIKGGGIDHAVDCVVVSGTTPLSGAGVKIVGVSLVPVGSGHAFLFQESAWTSSDPVVECHGVSVHGSCDRVLWEKPGSKVHFRAFGGTWEGATSQMVLNESTTGTVELDCVRMPAGKQRSDGAGFIRDRNGLVDAPPAGYTPESGGIYLTAQTTSIAAKDAFFPGASNHNPPAGGYIATIDLCCTTISGSGAPTVQGTLVYNDDSGNRSTSTTTLSLAALGSLHALIPFSSNGVGGVTIATTVASASGSPQYSLRCTVKPA